MQYAIFPMRTINISQRFHSGHKAWDLAGEDTGIDYWYAPCRVKVLAIFPIKTTGFYNTVLFGSCDESGNPAEVMCEDGIARVLTFGCTHMNTTNTFGLAAGKIYESGEVCYCEGNTGLGSKGNHVHMDVAEGWHYQKVKQDGQWLLPNLTNIANVFQQLKGWNVTKNLNGYTFKTVDSREIIEVKEPEAVIPDDPEVVEPEEIAPEEPEIIIPEEVIPETPENDFEAPEEEIVPVEPVTPVEPEQLPEGSCDCPQCNSLWNLFVKLFKLLCKLLHS